MEIQADTHMQRKPQSGLAEIKTGKPKRKNRVFDHSSLSGAARSMGHAYGCKLCNYSPDPAMEFLTAVHLLSTAQSQSSQTTWPTPPTTSTASPAPSTTKPTRTSFRSHYSPFSTVVGFVRHFTSICSLDMSHVSQFHSRKSKTDSEITKQLRAPRRRRHSSRSSPHSSPNSHSPQMPNQ